MSQTEYSLWLLPAEPLRGVLCAIIRNLARIYDSVEFEPHVTIYSGPSDDAEASEILHKLATQFTAVNMNLSKLGLGTEYTKAVFINVNDSAAARVMRELAKTTSSSPHNYVLRPHLSLLYKRLPGRVLIEVSQSLLVPDGEYPFDRVRVVETEVPVTGPDSIRRWRTVGDCSLNGTAA